jgi:hypothetical protein
LSLPSCSFERYPDEKAEALEHLDFAIGEFRAMKMQPSLERTLKRREVHKAQIADYRRRLAGILNARFLSQK